HEMDEDKAAEPKKMIADYVMIHIRYNDRYFDNALIQRIANLQPGEIETVTISSDVSYSFFQDTLEEDNSVTTARSQLALFLEGTGYTPNYKITDLDGKQFYELVSITKGDLSLKFETQNNETLLDGEPILDVIGISLLTARTHDIDVQSGYLEDDDVTEIRTDQYQTISEIGKNPLIYFEGFEETSVYVSETDATLTRLRNANYSGMFYAYGGQARDHFDVVQSVGVTFLSGGGNDDRFTVGQGSVEQIDNQLFLLGGSGNDSVIVDANENVDDQSVTLEKQVAQHLYEKRELNRITNALDFTIDDLDENKAIEIELEDVSTPYATKAAMVNRGDLMNIVHQASNENASNILAQLQESQANYRDSITDLNEKQEANLKAYLSHGLTEYYNARLAKEDKEIAAEKTRAQLESSAASSVQNALYSNGNWKKWLDQVESNLRAWFNSNKPGWREYYVYFSDDKSQRPNAEGLLQGYEKDGADTLTLDIALKFWGSPDQTVYGYADSKGVKRAVDAQLSRSTYTISVEASYRSKIDLVKALKEEWKELEQELKEKRLKLEGSIDSLGSFYQSKGTSYGLTEAELNRFYGEVESYGIDRAVELLLDRNSTYKNAKDSISTEITNASKASKEAYETAIAQAEKLSQLSGSSLTTLQDEIDALQEDMQDLNNALVDLGNTPSQNERLVQLAGKQQLPYLQFAAEQTRFGSIENLISEIPDELEFQTVREFAAREDVTWDEAMDLYEDADYQAVENSHELGSEIASSFVDYKTDKYKAFRAASRNMGYLDTAYEFLSGDFSFEAFKAKYQENVRTIEEAPNVNELLRLESQYQQQIKSLEADEKVVNAIVNRNASVEAFMTDLKNRFQAELDDQKASLKEEYTVTIWYWYGSKFEIELPYTNDVRYTNALSKRNDAVANLNQANSESGDALSDQSVLQNKLDDVKLRLAEVQDELSGQQKVKNARVELGKQYRFLRDLSPIAVNVLSETRGDQAAKDFGDARSLLSEIKAYGNAYELLNTPGQPAKDGKYESTSFESTGSGNSVDVVSKKWDSFPVLSVLGLNSLGIHAEQDTIENLTVYLGSGADVIKIHDSLAVAGSTVSVKAGEGDDDFRLHSPKDSQDELTTYTSSVEDYLGDVVIDAEGGKNKLRIDDSGDETGDTMIQKASGNYLSISGMAPGVIEYAATGGDFSKGLDIFTSNHDTDGRDVFDAQDLFPTDHTKIDTGKGDDDIFIRDTTVESSALLTIFSQQGSDVIDASDAPLFVTVHAAEGNDSIYGSQFDDFLYGDKADAGLGGADLVIGNLGHDTIQTYSGTDILIGDRGHFRSLDGQTDLTMRSWPIGAVVSSVAGNSPTDDRLEAGQGDDVVFGGSGGDTIIAGTGDNNEVVLGDHGKAVLNADGKLVSIESTESGHGGSDQITVGQGNHVLIGGAFTDHFKAGDGNVIIIGDEGKVERTADGKELVRVESLNPAEGDVDTFDLGQGEYVVIAGAGDETITLGQGTNTVLGDNGSLEIDLLSGVTTVKSLAGDVGGEDTINVGNGFNIAVGGAKHDEIKVTGTEESARGYVVGDNGIIVMDREGRLLSIESSATETGDGTSEFLGDKDTITLTDGTNTVIGGVGGDTIEAGKGVNTILGDDGQALFNLGVLYKVESINSGDGGADQITLVDGTNTVIGGAAGDEISLGAGTNTVLGDEGEYRI
ncbi:MAG: hypothetical protein VX776_12410, partial [Planctomycetota bacterium]|nr:hypothetical protein [Planctomycetota bacterium]MEC9097433.1 hypothetical protein [Planctomycetota bacterium]